MSFPAANRDPEQFENPDVVDFEREHNRHVAFGAGIHRCAGSNLARLELRVALQVARAHPRVRAGRPGAVTWAGGQVRGTRIAKVKF
jgi:cytochrome P450